MELSFAIQTLKIIGKEFGIEEKELLSKLFRFLDSKDKKDGCFKSYLEALFGEEQGKVEMRKGTRELFSFLGISESRWDEKLKLMGVR